jgi:small conductance mechanosensitive channel
LGVAYGANLNEVLVVAKQVVAADPRVLTEPAARIGISELADSSVTISIQPWVAIGDMITARAALYQAIVERFRASKIEIPFPVREVRVLGAS